MEESFARPASDRSMSIKAIPNSGRNDLRKWAGDSTTISSSVGRTTPCCKWPPWRAAVALGDANMGMHRGLAFGFGDIADQAEHFDLLVDFYRLVRPRLQIEPGDRDSLKGADASEVRRGQVVFHCEALEFGHCFIPRIEDQAPLTLSSNVIEQFRFHCIVSLLPIFGAC